MSGHEFAFAEAALALDIGSWTIDFNREAVHWPLGLGLENAKKRYVWSPLSEVADLYAEADRVRFLAYLQDLLRHPGQDRAIDLFAKMPGGGHVGLRLSGRALLSAERSVAFGVVQCIDKLREAETLAKGVSGILEAVFLATDAGVLVFDDHVRIRRINPAALRLFDVDPGEGPRNRAMAAVQALLPAELVEELAHCVHHRAAASGTINLAGAAKPLLWRVNPYGRGENGLNGVVLLMTPPPPPPPLPRPDRQAGPAEGDGMALRILEDLRDPVVVVSMKTARVRFANQQGRNLLRMQDGHQYHVNNLYEVTRHMTRYQPPRDQIRHLPVKLPGGARVTRMTEADDELLVFEYVYR